MYNSWNWKDKLTPFDYECLMMVDSLTGRETEPKNGGDHYFFEADYSGIDSAEILSAIWEAIQGRFGERIVEMWDDPERRSFFVRVKFAEKAFKARYKEAEPPRVSLGIPVYAEGIEGELRALQVDRHDCERLLNFVGNGEMEMGDEGVSIHFLNCGGMIYTHAVEGDWLVYVGFDRFIKVNKNTFENEYKRI